jgi:hypothetical protein
MKLLIHANQLDIRGTGNAMYAYASYAKNVWGYDIHFAYDKNCHWTRPEGIQYVKDNFDWNKVIAYTHIDEVSDYVKQHNIDFAYMVKGGEWDKKLIRNCRVGIHAVFRNHQPHGDVYAYISQWLSDVMTNGTAPVVEYPVVVAKPNGNLRQQLGIPDSATVIGRHGGEDQFDLSWVHQFVYTIATRQDNIYFLFMNTNQFCPRHPRIIHLPPSMDLQHKSNFINTCDVMLHGRDMGDSFGMAVAEFLALGKPVVSYSGGGDQNHTRMINDARFMYNNPNNLGSCLNFALSQTGQPEYFKDKVKAYAIDNIMENQFKPIFLGK